MAAGIERGMNGAHFRGKTKKNWWELVALLRVLTTFVTLQEKNGRQAFFHLRLLILKKIFFVSVIGVQIYQGSVSKYFLNIFLALLYFFVQVYRPWYFWRFEKTQPFLAKNTYIFVSNFFFLQRNFKYCFWFKAKILFCFFSHKLNILGSIVCF